jgi:hypothetical protein
MNTTLQSVNNIKAKNILRGLIGAVEPKQVIKALSRIKKNCSNFDYVYSTEVLRDDFLFKNNGVLRNFIKFSPFQIPNLELTPQKTIILNIKNNSSALHEILVQYHQVLESVKNVNLEEACEKINKLIDEDKFSLFLVRILFFVKSCIAGIAEYEDTSAKIDSILHRTKISNMKKVELAIKELSNPRTDYFNVHKRIEAVDQTTSLNNIIKSFVFHIPKNRDDFERTLCSYYNFSLIDSFLYIASTARACNFLYINFDEIDKDLINMFFLLSKLSISDSLLISKNDSIENFFRLSFLLIELDECFKYKTIHSALYNQNPKKISDMTVYEKLQIGNYFSMVNSLQDICLTENTILNIERYDPKNSSILENSTALVYAINKLRGNISGQEDVFVRLMSCTKDIGFICPGDYLSAIEARHTTDELRLVVACLISIANQSDLTEYLLRKVVQNIIITRFENLLNLIKYMNDISISVTEHLIDICDETFISKLFNITDKPIAAIEERANILEWYGNEYRDLSIIERAKNLRIDVQISKQKETIDDARIYVEPTKFTKWVGEHYLNKITIQLEDSDLHFDSAPTFIQWEKVHSGFSHEDYIGSYLLSCYSEFCSNNLFGIASYLGRRIRHGTIEGTATTEVESIKKQEKFHSLTLIKGFEESFNKWFENYIFQLGELKTNRLQINCRKYPEGWIYPGFNTPAKVVIANNMFKEICNSYFVHKYSAGIPYIITDYCWRCVEEDLKIIRKKLGEFRSKYGTFVFDFKELNVNEKKLIQEFCHEINTKITDKFRTIITWFNKPSIASPSANLVLLFKAVLSEVKDRVEGFNPRVKINIDESRFTLSGGLYFVLYDAMNILIFNAAKHGKKDGALEFLVDDSFSANSIKLSIVSETNSFNDLVLAQTRINECLSKNFENAHIVEGESGIKKLKQMEEEGYIREVNYSFSNNSNEITATFIFDVSYK